MLWLGNAACAEVMSFPLEFYTAVALLVFLGGEACYRLRRSWAIPALVVYGTVGLWYLGDILYNGMDTVYATFGSEWVHRSLLQVVLFLAAYRFFIHILIRQDRDPNEAADLASRLNPVSIEKLLLWLSVLWAALFVLGISRVDWDVWAILWPPSREEKTVMFGHSGMGAGADFLVAACNYVYILVCASLGIVFVLSRGYVRGAALLLMAFAWPYFWFDRMRNIMLALLMPGLFTYWFSTQRGWGRKLAVSAVVFGFVNLWFLGVMRYREDNQNLGAILQFRAEEESSQHLGLDMFTELCWMNALMDVGSFRPDWGQSYLAQIAQVVPRTLWANKPMIGIDYAIARGFGGTGMNDSAENAAGVFATVTTGMIGGGVANFGQFLGVLAVALIMALWTKILACLWLRRFELLRFFLFAVGCGLTINMGRDITLLVLWPFVFGYIGVVLIEKFKLGSGQRARAPVASGHI